MSELSVDKLNQYKKTRLLTNKKISELTGVSLVTIDNIFSGKNKNPTVSFLLKIFRVLGCAMDNLVEYDKDSPLANYINNKEINDIAKEIQQNPNLKHLFNTGKNLTTKDIQLVTVIADRLQK